MFEVDGVVHAATEVESIGTNGFQKSTFVLKVDQKYDNLIAFELVQDQAGYVTSKHIGSNATVKFNLRGREYNGKYYTNLRSDEVSFQVSKTPVAKKGEKVDASTIKSGELVADDADMTDLPF